ncbi:6-phosphofructokinase [Pseudoalteromonas luteoviolacea B = ATCC 29581]|nr:6-phosphofructokinase [Pseudoalteromonas luteoviolacea B = ATCC 29581]
MQKKLRIGVLTSGGDAPGMNAAVRAIVLACKIQNFTCMGFSHGYNGLLDDETSILTSRHVNDVLRQGGTVLRSARCKGMLTPDGPKQAANTLLKQDIDALIVIGGDGSFRGMLEIEKHWDGLLVGLPGTIDNDLAFCDKTIGFATAVQTACDAIDKIRDTANAFERVFIVEVMGRHSGHIAFHVGLATGAEAILSFENFDVASTQSIVDELSQQILKQQHDKHSSFLIVLAENLWPNGPEALKKALKVKANIESGICILGHIQRGGSPIAEDRLLASKLGLAAVDACINGSHRVMLGELNGEVIKTDLEQTIKQHKPVSPFWVTAHKNVLKGFI